MWRPVADAKTSRRAWAAIKEIERGLVEHLRVGAPYAGRARNPMLSSGKVGLALFFAYLDAARPGSGAAERALEVLGDCIDDLAELNLTPSLYNGFCGTGWVTEHLTRELFAGDDDLAGPIDAALSTLLANPGLIKPYELVSGVSGFGTYLLERLPHPNAAALLPRVLDHLAAAAEESPAGCTWLTLPDWLPDLERGQRPRGCYTLGVAHGVPGVIGFLAAARRAGIPDPRIPYLAEGAVRWLLGRRLPGGGVSVFPAVIVPGREPEPARTAWCYGDLGIAAVLLAAARSFGRPDWEREALALARLAAGRSAEATGAIDAGLCHGTAGLSHLFLRIYQATGDPAMKAAALTWLERTLAIRRRGEGIAGFVSWVSAEPEPRGVWRGEAGFLAGVAGIGLTLLAAVTDVEPAWDRVMLASIPPGSEGMDRGGAP